MSVALILTVAATLLFLFRVPLALLALRHRWFEQQAERVVLNAGTVSVPYLLDGLDDSDRDFAGLCAGYLFQLRDVLSTEERIDMLEEVVCKTIRVSLEFRPVYLRGSSAFGFIRWKSEIDTDESYMITMRIVLVDEQGKHEFLARRITIARGSTSSTGLGGDASAEVEFLERDDDSWYPEVEFLERDDDSSHPSGGYRVWLRRLLKTRNALRWEAYVGLHFSGSNIPDCEPLVAQADVRVVDELSRCPGVPQPVQDASVDAWVQRNFQATMSHWNGGRVVLEPRHPGGNPVPLCFTVTIEMEEGPRFVCPRYLVLPAGKPYPASDAAYLERFFWTRCRLSMPGIYRMRVILEGTPEAALSHPAVTRYWAGRYESPWQTVTVPEQ